MNIVEVIPNFPESIDGDWNRGFNEAKRCLQPTFYFGTANNTRYLGEHNINPMVSLRWSDYYFSVVNIYTSEASHHLYGRRVYITSSPQCFSMDKQARIVLFFLPDRNRGFRAVDLGCIQRLSPFIIFASCIPSFH